jgi:asparagine synthase (glutamine-hydrolysing)
MCGICGTLNFNDIRVSVADVQRMVSALRHRGPDSSGILDDRRAILGHTRLSIIDLSTGDQPMGTPDGRFWIVFNGEIYNYLELKRELTSCGHVFATESDTEVILAAYRQWGTECFGRLNGQWALAIWDRTRKSLLLSRDRVGIRPLHYTWLGKTLVFASEIKAIFQCDSVRRAIDPDGLAQIFTLWGPVAPSTAFGGVHQLEPGHWLEITDGRVRSARYWELSFGSRDSAASASIEENTERFRAALISAAQLRFDRSDVPVGAYLSGGIDSSVSLPSSSAE